MRFTIIANADAGSADSIDQALAILSRVGESTVVWTESPSDIDRALAALHGTVPIIAGGDGSIHLFANRYVEAGAETPVGILPLGTGNDLARGLGLPLDPVDAAGRIVDGQPHALPLFATPGNEIGVNNSHVGLGVAAARRGADWKAGIGPWAYPAGSMVEGLTYDGIDVSIDIEGDRWFSGKVLTVMVLNGPSAGGGFHPLEDVDPLSPSLEVLVVEASGIGSRVGLALAAIAGHLEDEGDVLRTSAETITIVVPDGEEWELDGEFRTWANPVEFTVTGRSLPVLL